jgi:hypothetical protein
MSRNRVGDLSASLASWAYEFVAAPASPRPLAAFRIGLAAVLLVQAWALTGSLVELYGDRGIVQWAVSPYTIPAGIPTLNRVTELGGWFGISDLTCVRSVFLLYVAGLLGLLLGWYTRASAFVAWITHLAMKATGSASIYGVDEFAHIALFYAMFMPVGRAFSWDAGGVQASDPPSSGARLALRILQLHLCVVYFSSGIEKIMGEQWRNGEAIWRSLMREDFGQFDMSWLAEVPWLAKLICWGTLVVEIGYAFFVWPRRTRTLWACATLGLHLGIGVMLGLWSFAAVMMVLTFSAFLVSADAPTISRTIDEPEAPVLRGDLREAITV